VLVEVLVLGRQEGRDDDLRHRLDRQVEPALTGVLGEQAAVGGVDAGHHRRLVVRERRVVGQVARVLPEEVAARRRTDDDCHRRYAEQEAEEAEDEAHRNPIRRWCRAALRAGLAQGKIPQGKWPTPRPGTAPHRNATVTTTRNRSRA
jgi:hypothetical protein